MVAAYSELLFLYDVLLILGGTILVDYFAGLLIARSSGKTRKAWLVLSIITNVGVLLLYKYYFFLLDTIAPVLRDLFPHYDIPYMNFILPIGLSFHTFRVLPLLRAISKPAK
jgi:alginate O-acetyltransferase complex protein AlgI